ncbi:MAG: DEAD/DEAH box helicase [Rhodospirillaceae bacterium]|jgi:ATP-dependent RNA helicase DeaD|nr:DEAD/DEAH box helicase [Rhodospirillaceae bacterium]MBT3495190.1 DEAD/DEAH box helicase [Rhodospirillaceae bacterium]MBT3781056.1 DEAD/DEAH box helicase [Rhodospirillaceae bacterium]MBT3977386.1 DEAD/DEAH box helicase [Rhodospirillaceae bacterium]MBT4565040.1 DEAD/DEAH box helicase [Rhodospirillaceae bacterium]
MTDIAGVVSALGQALEKRGYATLTPVQEAVLAPELRDADTLVSAQTGSGKTVAFGLALAPTLLNDAERFVDAEAPLALVVAPTRELALQVKRELEWLYEMTGALHASCVGGMDMRTERRALQRGAHIVVGTPGRLRDHIERGSLDVGALRAVVLDEADEMLDMGFREDLEYILDAAPKERRTMLFSATVPRTIAALAKRYQRDAVRISTQAEQSQHLDIEYRALTVAPNDRENAIINVLRYFEARTALVFCSTRAAVNHMTARFNNRGFSVVALSGELSQSERTNALQAMRSGRARVCIATDVAARGIDLPNCELVIHADLPRNREGLLHRSGRTGRAGRKGVSVLVVPHNWRRRTERLLQSANIEATWARPPSVVEVMRRDDERLLADPGLTEPMQDEEQAFAKELLGHHSAEQVAAAYVRLYRAGRSAPEELLDTGPRASGEPGNSPGGKRRDDFKNGVWISLSVGRKHQAEPRWVLPMLCRAGNITKREIGAIRIEQNETYVEFAPEAIDRFLEAVGPSRAVEKNVTVTRLDGMPKSLRPDRDKSQGKKPYEKKPFGKKKPYGEARADTSAEPELKRSFILQADKAPGDEKTWDKSATQSQPKATIKPKSKGKKKKRAPSHKPKLAKAGARVRVGEKPGFSPLKRKKAKPAG